MNGWEKSLSLGQRPRRHAALHAEDLNRSTVGNSQRVCTTAQVLVAQRGGCDLNTLARLSKTMLLVSKPDLDSSWLRLGCIMSLRQQVSRPGVSRIFNRGWWATAIGKPSPFPKVPFTRTLEIWRQLVPRKLLNHRLANK